MTEWEKWDQSTPIFEAFWVIGPEKWEEGAEAKILFAPSEEQYSCARQKGIETLVFQGNANFKLEKVPTAQERLLYMTSKNEVTNRVVFCPQEALSVRFLYCTVFRASPLTQPGGLVPHCVETFKQFRKESKMPMCDFAFCFLSSHPFSDLLFAIQDQLLEMEALSRSTDDHKAFLTSNTTRTEWPSTISTLRTQFLRAIQETRLPGFGTRLSIRIANNPPWIWEMPAAKDVANSFVKLGAHPLLDWISWDQFAMLISAALRFYSLIVISDNMSDRSRTVAFLAHLIDPFPICSSITPMMKDESADGMLESPSPMIGGFTPAQIQRDRYRYCDLIGRDKDGKLDEGLCERRQCLIHLDAKTIVFPSDLKPIPFHKALLAFLSSFDDLSSRDESTPVTVMKCVYNFLRTNFADAIVKSLKSSRNAKGELVVEPDQAELAKEFAPYQESMQEIMGEQPWIAFSEQVSLAAKARAEANTEVDGKEEMPSVLLETMAAWHEKVRRQDRRVEYEEKNMADILMETHVGDLVEAAAPYRNYS